MLPPRGGSRHLDHAITYFDHVRLPASALLGDLEKPADMRQNFIKVIWRVSIGSLALTTWTASALQLSAYITGKYSLRRTVRGSDGSPSPIISFRTQQQPILRALASGYVLEAYGRWAAKKFVETGKDTRVQSGIAATMKAVMAYHSATWLVQLGARCGAQGLYRHNQIIQIELDQRGCFIAEGDTLALCIRLASELLIGRYSLPRPTDPNSPLARHEAGLFAECKDILASFGGNHRSESFNRLVLPLSVPLIRAIGHRMAYEAALSFKLDKDIIELFVVGIIQDDLSWFVENAGMKRQQVHQMEDDVLTRLVPRLDKLLDETGAEPYVTAPIVTEERMAKFIAELPFFEGDALVKVIDDDRKSGRGLEGQVSALEKDSRIWMVKSSYLSKL